MSRREMSLDAINREIAREKAEALGQAGERLERLLRELWALASALQQPEGTASPEAVAQAERRYATARIGPNCHTTE